MSTCGRCEKPVDQAKPHVSYVRNVERLDGDEIEVADSVELEQRHEECDR